MSATVAKRERARRPPHAHWKSPVRLRCPEPHRNVGEATRVRSSRRRGPCRRRDVLTLAAVPPRRLSGQPRLLILTLGSGVMRERSCMRSSCFCSAALEIALWSPLHRANGRRFNRARACPVSRGPRVRTCHLDDPAAGRRIHAHSPPYGLPMCASFQIVGTAVCVRSLSECRARRGDVFRIGGIDHTAACAWPLTCRRPPTRHSSAAKLRLELHGELRSSKLLPQGPNHWQLFQGNRLCMPA